MDKFNVIWCALWSDYIMTIHQYDPETEYFSVTTDVAQDFLFFLSEILGIKKDAYLSENSKDVAVVGISKEEMDRLIDWILDFNSKIRKPAGLPMPDLYLDEEKILDSTVIIYCNLISGLIYQMLTHQNEVREKVADWAAENFSSFYMRAYAEALQEKSRN